MKIILSEEQYNSLILEYYDSEKLYSRNYVIDRIRRGPRELRKFVKDLPFIPCTDKEGNEVICTKIPEVIYVFLTGQY
jgi:hypothetical protein